MDILFFFSVNPTVSGELNNEAIMNLPTIEVDQITQPVKPDRHWSHLVGKQLCARQSLNSFE